MWLPHGDADCDDGSLTKTKQVQSSLVPKGKHHTCTLYTSVPISLSSYLSGYQVQYGKRSSAFTYIYFFIHFAQALWKRDVQITGKIHSLGERTRGARETRLTEQENPVNKRQAVAEVLN